MNPHQMAKSQCDNYQPDGSCLGANIADDLTIKSCTPRPKCLLALDRIQRCQHFEECILPYKPDHKNPTVAANKKADWLEGTHQYRMATGSFANNLRLCPQCKIEKIQPGRKVCDKCKVKNRAATKRTYKQGLKGDSSSICDVDNQQVA